VLIKTPTLEKIKAGDVSLVFRRWKRPSVKPNGTQMTQIGVLAIESVDVVTGSQITDADARAAGFNDRAELLAALPVSDLDIYRVAVSFAGEDPRIALRENAVLGGSELGEIAEKVSKLDSRESWTRSYLELIDSMPGVYSGLLADFLGVSKDVFKPRVRKLKALGLTESLEVGYRLSPRGRTVLEYLRQHDR
jgi:hypothetical protein